MLATIQYRTFCLLVKEDEIGSACSTNGVEEECMWNFGGTARRKEITRKTKT
jgi:hypothetical protein